MTWSIVTAMRFRATARRHASTPGEVAASLQLVLASRYLERLADHATNIAEDIIFWVRGSMSARAGHEFRCGWYSCYREFIAS